MRIVTLAVLSCVLVVVVAHAPGADAALINLANGKPIIGGGGDYPSGAFNSGGTYGTFNVPDGQNSSPDNHIGMITEQFSDGSYWLGQEGVTTGYFVLDLGALYRLGDIVLFNTSNGEHQDSGTGDFTIKASATAADTFTPTGWDLTGTVVTIASGTLLPETGVPAVQDPVLAQPFVSSDPTSYFRYIRFDALNIGTIGGDSRVGLNEIRLFASTVPEPSTLSLTGLAIVGLAMRARRRSRS